MADCPDVLTWVDPDGGSLLLAAANGVVVGRKAGFGMPPIDITQDVVPFTPGGVTTAVRHGVRKIDVVLVPNVVSAPSTAGLRAVLRDLAYRMDPTRGVGYLSIVTPVDSLRIACRYEQGMEWNEARGLMQAALPMVATFRCDSPYFEALTETAIGPEVMAGGGAFFPILPVSFSSSDFTPQFTIVNTGSAPAEPVWTVTGPCSSAVVITNTTYSESMTVDVTLGAGEVLTIDTRTGSRAIEVDGVSVLGSFYGELFTLRPGTNVVDVLVPAATAGATTVEGSYRRRELTT